MPELLLCFGKTLVEHKTCIIVMKHNKFLITFMKLKYKFLFVGFIQNSQCTEELFLGSHMFFILRLTVLRQKPSIFECSGN